ncbi:dethiobiotin synthase [Achromobacter seleniivolatilans]|uniref:ATP-dependent dethiobiotin synthetase BioD n=1 Tax=Achromobacter seleniivolatilans TaxID=3047478 RepID=A0ABY9M2A8_9BURK|nr:dethiobiotin synthase [Achromobacter sp. R39]WMD21136.1 dethiobiotin synthase [Achromobacter sp. R39]
MTQAFRNDQVGARFGAAAGRYEDHAPIQRITAERLASDIAQLPLPPRPRILEIGCGTGLLTQALARQLGAADWTVTDIAPGMLAAAQRGPALPGTARYALLDGEQPQALTGQYDLICSSLAVQWFSDLNTGLGRLAELLAPGGYLAIATLAEGTFKEWQAAHEAACLVAATPHYPPRTAIRPAMVNLNGSVRSERLIQNHPDGLNFLKGLKGIGATTPAPGRPPLSAAQLRRVLTAFDEQGATVTYHLAYGMWKKSMQRPAGVFVTGTDTGIGKTLVSAILARAWNADYWKPVQTGVSEEPGDTETVAQLARLPSERLHLPAYVLQAPLSPWAAATLEDTVVDATSIVPPVTQAPLIVEGAGGLYVPIDDTHMMIDLIARLDMPVVLAARSGLGTINHTLLSLEALKRRGIPVLGVIMSGPLSAGNKEAIERFGDVRVLAEIPSLAKVDAAAVDALAQTIPPLDECLAALGRAAAEDDLQALESARP